MLRLFVNQNIYILDTYETQAAVLYLLTLHMYTSSSLRNFDLAIPSFLQRSGNYSVYKYPDYVSTYIISWKLYTYC